MRLPRPLENLIDQLSKLPTIGPKTAQRLALYILKMPGGEVKELAQSILDARFMVYPCPICGNLTDKSPCIICQDEERDRSLLCVVEEASDILAIERTGYNGRYYVLNRTFRLMEDGDLTDIDTENFQQMLQPIVQEVILAMNPTIDGEVISRYLHTIVEEKGIKVTRLAHGLPVGGDIEYADEITLRQALEGRKEI
ncbi:MAG TPA: recombination protein RecR [Syntrophomonadaceae bacterium]|nr:recombination protein RecR [Syntrophomonadaceae bacterium]